MKWRIAVLIILSALCVGYTLATTSMQSVGVYTRFGLASYAISRNLFFPAIVAGIVALGTKNWKTTLSWAIGALFALEVVPLLIKIMK